MAASSSPDFRPLERGFVCPERLKEDAARMRAVMRFIAHYGAIAPRSSIAERIAFRDRLMARRRCKPEVLQHSFPEL